MEYRLSVDDIYKLYVDRRRTRGPLLARMEEIRTAYNGELVIPMAELSAYEKAAVPNLVAQGIDQTATRIASTTPNVYCPPIKIGVKSEEKNARKRRSAILGWWEQNNMELKLRRRARWLQGYACAPVCIRPSGLKNIPCWYVRDPLSTYPAPDADPDSLTPTDVIFTFQKPISWIDRHYPLNNLRRRKSSRPDTPIRLIEYMDAEQTVLIALTSAVNLDTGQFIPTTTTTFEDTSWTNSDNLVVLERAINLAGICPAVIPGRITLDREQGQYDGIVGMYQSQAMLFALNFRAVAQDVWPNEWLVSHPNQQAKIIKMADGRTGEIGEIQGGDIKSMHLNPGYKSDQLMDRLERNQRVSAGIPSEFGGECVDPETEIFTINGWKTYDQVVVGDQVLTLDNSTGLSEWQPIQKLNVFDGPATMHEMHGPRHSSLSTANHRWPIIGWNGRRRWRFSPYLTGSDQIPIAAMNTDIPADPKYSDSLVELVAWYYTEGHNRGSGGAIYQSTKKMANVERIRSALHTLFGPATQNWRTLSGCGQGGVGHDEIPRWNEIPPNPNHIVHFKLSKHLIDALETYAPNKVPTNDFLRTLTQSQLELFIHVSLLADNCGDNKFGQKDRARTEAFGYACILAGDAVSYHTRVKTESREGWKAGEYVSYQCYRRKRRVVKPKENAQRGVSTFREVPYSGIVWCPTTENGTWYARRNGSVYFTGNSPSNVRTGRRGDSILSAVVDFPIQEAQTLLAKSLECENKIAVAIDKAYYGNDSKSFYVDWKGARGQVDYIPNKIFTTDQNRVYFPAAGVDANNLTISLGQLVGTELMSRRTAMELHPFIDDAEEEDDRITIQGLHRAMQSSIEQMAAQGAIPPTDLARIAELVATDRMELYEAVQTAQEEAQQRQAEQNPQGSAPTQPGLSQPGMGAEAGAAVPEVTPSAHNLASVLGSLYPAQAAMNG